jgi:hypothetical protein
MPIGAFLTDRSFFIPGCSFKLDSLFLFINQQTKGEKMKALKFILLFACLILFASSVRAQDDYKPKPIDNETMKMLMGTWKSDPYEMMGSKWTETAVHSMVHNGQYMNIEITAVNEKNQTYSASIYITIDKDGKWSGWGFDDWGGVTTMSGTADKGKITANSTSSYGSETRVIEINGNTMVHNASMTMKGTDGKDMTMKSIVTYHKQ